MDYIQSLVDLHPFFHPEKRDNYLKLDFASLSSLVEKYYKTGQRIIFSSDFNPT